MLQMKPLTNGRKTNTKSIIGTSGTQGILDYMTQNGLEMGTVAIGGINLSNVQRVLYQSQASRKGLNGVAIVSAIMAADDPQAAAGEFARRIKAPAPFATLPKAPRANEAASLLEEVPGVVREVVKAHPLAHNMINYVVANFVANVILSMYVSASTVSCLLFIHIANTRSGELLPLCRRMETRQWILSNTMVP